MQTPIANLKNKIFAKKSKETVLTPIIKLIRDLGCIDQIIGNDFEVYDAKGKLVYTIRQKPITVPQISTLMKELNNLEIEENESNKNNKPPKKGKR
jgi:hypothetical protein